MIKTDGMHYKRGDAGVVVYDGNYKPVFMLPQSYTTAEIERHIEMYVMAYDEGYKHGVVVGYDCAKHDVSKALNITHS